MVEPIGNSSHSYSTNPHHNTDVDALNSGYQNFIKALKNYNKTPNSTNLSALKFTYTSQCESRISGMKSEYPTLKANLTTLEGAYQSIIDNPNQSTDNLTTALKDVTGKIPS